MDQNSVLFLQEQDIFSKYFVFIFRIETNNSFLDDGWLLGFFVPQTFVLQIFMFSRLKITASSSTAYKSFVIGPKLC